MTKQQKVFQTVSEIPLGKVATYGQIASIADTGPRAVGTFLHRNTNPKKYPCHRVIHSDGTLAKGYAFGGLQVQESLLKKEGIQFQRGKIDLNKFGWFGQ